jgi:hypothetical protein
LPWAIILLGIPVTMAASHALLRSSDPRPRKVNVDYSDRGGFFLMLLIPRVQLPTLRYYFAFREVPGIPNRSRYPTRNGPCKFPPSHRRRFSLIADRSPCPVINVSYDGGKSNDSAVEGREESVPEEENNRTREKGGNWSADGWTDRSLNVMGGEH